MSSIYWLSIKERFSKDFTSFAHFVRLSDDSMLETFSSKQKLVTYLHSISDQIIVFLYTVSPIFASKHTLFSSIGIHQTIQFSSLLTPRNFYTSNSWTHARTHARKRTHLKPPERSKLPRLGVGLVRRFCFNIVPNKKFELFELNVITFFNLTCWGRHTQTYTRTRARTHSFTRQHETWANFYLSFLTSHSSCSFSLSLSLIIACHCRRLSFSFQLRCV